MVNIIVIVILITYCHHNHNQNNLQLPHELISLVNSPNFSALFINQEKIFTKFV
jgi:hypothetical protein